MAPGEFYTQKPTVGLLFASGPAMARTIKAHEHAEKRAQILDAAQRLIYTRGYEQLTIQDLLTELQISKGAFYHYFDSKQALLEALLERLQQEGEQLFTRIIRDTGLPVLARLQHFFDSAGRWKTAQKDYLLALLRVWYTDDNAVVRLRVQATMAEHIGPLLTELIAEGVAAGVLDTTFPDQAGTIVIQTLVGAGDSMARLILADPRQPDRVARAERLMAAYDDALARVLGAPPGSLHLIDPETLREWFTITAVEV